MSIIFSDDINDNRGEDLRKRVDTIYDYIAYMKEQLEFWARNRTREISGADAKIKTYEDNLTISDATITVHKPMFMDGVLGSTHTQNQWDNSVDLLTIEQLYQGNAWRVDQYVDNYPANSPLGVARAVYYRQQFAYWTTSLQHAVLVLWEVYPVPSRIWVAAYDYGQGGWQSWKSITLS